MVKALLLHFDPLFIVFTLSNLHWSASERLATSDQLCLLFYFFTLVVVKASSSSF